MEIRRHDDLAAFAELARPLLHADPVRHTIAVTLLASRLRPGAPADTITMLTVHAGGAVHGAALRSRRLPLIASALPADAAPAVADFLLAGEPAGTAPPSPDGAASSRGDAPGDAGRPGAAPEALPGVTGPRENAEAFAAHWCRRTGAATRVDMAQRLFALAELRPPAGVPGRARVAGPDDVPLLARWRQAFAAAALPAGWPHDDDPEATVARQLAAGQGNVLWEVDGEQVAMAAASMPAAGMSRVAAVWTPPEHRGRGFGSAVTAATSRWALEAGARHVVLFTDLDNPVSNSIYRKIGYRPVHDAVEFAFEPGP